MMTDEEIVYYLQGSCNSISSLEEEEQARFDDTDFLAWIDNEIFNCNHCGWWCNIEDLENSKMDEWICTECKEDENDGN